jgi:hypothetical protein
MNKILLTLFVTMSVMGCSNNPKDIVEDEKDIPDNRISLSTDTINVVKLTDTLVIYQSTCRGCAYEKSANFAISDSMNMIKLADIITTDNNPDNMDGGSISKDLILVPQKTGITIIKLYKFWTQEKTAADSARFASYKIEVKQ